MLMPRSILKVVLIQSAVTISIMKAFADISGRIYTSKRLTRTTNRSKLAVDELPLAWLCVEADVILRSEQGRSAQWRTFADISVGMCASLWHATDADNKLNCLRCTSLQVSGSGCQCYA
eukprot:313898-Amphidinium_carterae.1